MEPAAHLPVLLDAVLEFLAPTDGELLVDATVGAGGHAAAMLERAPGLRLVGLDRDPVAVDLARRRLAPFGERARIEHLDYRQLPGFLDQLGLARVDAILVDLGVSSMQLDDPARGFSFRFDGPLDMRMGSDGITAEDIVNRASEHDLAEIFRSYGEEPLARGIARRIVAERAKAPIKSTGRLAEIVAQVKRHRGQRPGATHPATQAFQALRIEVNRELEGLSRFLEDAVERLRPGGRLAAISFHSLEDRIVKQTLRGLSDGCRCDPGLPVCVCGRRRVLEILTRRPVRPTPQEIATNPRSRSARLRAGRRI